MEIDDIARKIFDGANGSFSVEQSKALASQMLESTHGGISPEDVKDVTVSVKGNALDIQLHVDFDTMPKVFW